MSINEILSIVDKEKKKFYYDNKSSNIIFFDILFRTKQIIIQIKAGGIKNYIYWKLVIFHNRVTNIFSFLTMRTNQRPSYRA